MRFCDLLWKKSAVGLCLIVLVFQVMLVGCGDDEDPGTDPDAGFDDVGEEDTGTEDTGTEDTGDEDTGLDCEAPEMECEGQCVDTDTTFEHCGDCGDPCQEGQLCVGGICEDEVPGEGVSFADDVVPIFDANCTSCHGVQGGLNLSVDPYEELVNVESADCAPEVRVVPEDADGSYLIMKLEGSPDICGVQMPQGGQLGSEDIETIRQWIDEGAEDN